MRKLTLTLSAAALALAGGVAVAAEDLLHDLHAVEHDAVVVVAFADLAGDRDQVGIADAAAEVLRRQCVRRDGQRGGEESEDGGVLHVSCRRRPARAGRPG